ncbi:MAG: 2,3-bisphosphoglycerate-independent phosphoglycerate mutase, partial [Firmicutes bacterium]|nr:2,3-bisphosphoglycerate-independent phosphoglycerate mutase [Bacillota bacterium]
MSNCGKPLLLVILDGWGMPEHTEYDATTLAKTPVFDALWANNPHTQLSASGLDVGLPAGQMGNSEVGHTNIGAGRVIYQDLTYISRQIEQGEFFRNPALTAVCDHCAKEGKALHLLGLLSDGGIHSHLSHVLALLELAKQRGVERLYLHAFTDGRDTLKKVAENYIIAAETKMAELGLGQV